MRSAPPVKHLSNLGRFLWGANGLEQYGGRRVSISSHRAVFRPSSTEPNAADNAAYALFCFNVEDYVGENTFLIDWESAPAPGTAWFGLGNQDTSSWDWILPDEESGALVVEDLAPYTNELNRLVLTVVILEEGEYILNSVLLGERWVVEGVDLTEVFAPPLEREIHGQWQQWSERNPVEDNYRYIGEVTDGDGFRHAVISHMVDGYTHYASMRHPVATGHEKYPLIVYCHPGAGGGAGLYAEADFVKLINDDGFTDQFYVATPSFRSEPCHGGDVGSFSSDGPASVNDRDADDTIAMIDCLINHFPDIDIDNIFVYGFSRGAQVAVRVGQRDHRIKGVATFCGYTDEWAPSLQAWTADALSLIGSEEPSNHFAHIVWDLVYGTGDVWAARSSLLLTTTAYFCEPLPAIQLHYGRNDDAVDIDQGRRLEEVLAELETVPYEYIEYNAGHGEFHTLGGGDNLKRFLQDLMGQ